jgi:acetyl esterase
MRFYWQSYLPHEADVRHPWAAPLLADLAGLPPMFVPLAELDVLLSEGEALVAKARGAGVAAELRTYPGCIHGFLRQVATVTKARQAVADCGAFLRHALRPDTEPMAA